MRIDIGPIKAVRGGSVDYDFQFQPDELDLGEEGIAFPEPLRVSGTVTNTGECFYLKGVIRGKVRFVCDRCLEPYTCCVDSEMEYEFVSDSTIRRKGFSEISERHEEKDEFDLRWFKGDEIEITDEVIESILVDLPSKRLCDPDCKGICPKCGINRNSSTCDCGEDVIDPRMSGLSKLLT